MNRQAIAHQARSMSLAERLREREEILLQTADALSSLLPLIDSGLEATPQVARSIQATENRWRAMDREFGLLDSRQVAELLGSAPTNRNRAHALAKEGRILGVKRGRGVLYPGFQFDPDTGDIRPAVAAVAEVGVSAGWESRHILQWFCSPNGYLGGARPVDTMNEQEKLIAAATADMAARW